MPCKAIFHPDLEQGGHTELRGAPPPATDAATPRSEKQCSVVDLPAVCTGADEGLCVESRCGGPIGTANSTTRASTTRIGLWLRLIVPVNGPGNAHGCCHNDFPSGEPHTSRRVQAGQTSGSHRRSSRRAAL